MNPLPEPKGFVPPPYPFDVPGPRAQPPGGPSPAHPRPRLRPPSGRRPGAVTARRGWMIPLPDLSLSGAFIDLSNKFSGCCPCKIPPRGGGGVPLDAASSRGESFSARRRKWRGAGKRPRKSAPAKKTGTSFPGTPPENSSRKLRRRKCCRNNLEVEMLGRSSKNGEVEMSGMTSKRGGPRERGGPRGTGLPRPYPRAKDSEGERVGGG